jgi:16S rRNA (cytosine967-C5)-methyltransferase
MAYDLNNAFSITATDKRPSILKTLDTRFKTAGIKNYSFFVVDLETITLPDLATLLDHQSFDAVIADVPCTGSGTWARTPEDLYFFKKENIKKYVRIQQQVISKSVLLLKDNGVFIYITCSVFKQENEQQVDFIRNKGLRLLQSSLLKGYHEQADTLFIAIFKK